MQDSFFTNNSRLVRKAIAPALAFIFAFLFAYSDVTSQFMLLCGKDFSFSLAILFLLFFVLTDKKTFAHHPFSLSLTILFMSVVLTLASTEILPDNWHSDSHNYDSDLPIIPLSWLTAIVLGIAAYVAANKQPSRRFVGLIIIVLSLSASASYMEAAKTSYGPITKDNSSLVFQEIVYDTKGGFVHHDWVVENVNFTELNHHIRESKGQPQDWTTHLINGEDDRPVQMHITFDNEKGITLSVYRSLETATANSFAPYVSFVFVFISLLLSLYLFKFIFKQND